MKKLYILILIIVSQNIFANINFARLHYNGGGDWYNDSEVLPNLAKFINKELKIKIDIEQKIVKVDGANIDSYPFIFLTGHGNIKLSKNEENNVRSYLMNGGFI
ncbi:MAG: DUF4159 domain-containing protein, partial [Candidatus Cloacimonadota bacterium]|nr:DUF4159 domain-containing protein [Candidatus Cloacimonadota bacterium]